MNKDILNAQKQALKIAENANRIVELFDSDVDDREILLRVRRFAGAIHVFRSVVVEMQDIDAQFLYDIARTIKSIADRISFRIECLTFSNALMRFLRDKSSVNDAERELVLSSLRIITDSIVDVRSCYSSIADKLNCAENSKIFVGQSLTMTYIDLQSQIKYHFELKEA